eukprot:SAG31_NODE_12_length_38498_cov_21.161671_8_plen_53_part_00
MYVTILGDAHHALVCENLPLIQEAQPVAAVEAVALFDFGAEVSLRNAYARTV